MPPSHNGSLTAVLVGLVGLGISLLLAVSALARADWDPTVFVGFGEDTTEINSYAEERVGDISLRPHDGHDGKYFFVQANDPFLLEPEENIAILDAPLYRAQRMLYPVLAGAFGLFESETIVWAMIAVNVLAMGFGSWVVAQLAMELGGSALWGLAFPLNPGFISEMLIDGSGIIAGVFAFLALLLLKVGRRRAAVGSIVLAVLAREATIVVAAGVALWAWLRKDRKFAVALLGLPFGAMLIWGLYVRLQVGFGAGLTDVQAVGLPFVGLFESFGGPLNEPIDLAARLGILLLFAMFLLRAIPSRSLMAWAFVGFVPLGLLFVEAVWSRYFDVTRAVAPLITAFFLLFFLDDQRSTETTREDALGKLS